MDNDDMHSHKQLDQILAQNSWKVSRGLLEMTRKSVLKEKKRTLSKCDFCIWNFAGCGIHITRVKVASKYAG